MIIVISEISEFLFDKQKIYLSSPTTHWKTNLTYDAIVERRVKKPAGPTEKKAEEKKIDITDPSLEFPDISSRNVSESREMLSSKCLKYLVASSVTSERTHFFQKINTNCFIFF